MARAHAFARRRSWGLWAFRTVLIVLLSSAVVSFFPDAAEVLSSLMAAHAVLSFAVGVMGPVPTVVEVCALAFVVVVPAPLPDVLQPAASRPNTTMPPIQKERMGAIYSRAHLRCTAGHRQSLASPPLP